MTGKEKGVNLVLSCASITAYPLKYTIAIEYIDRFHNHAGKITYYTFVVSDEVAC